jgi:dipeptidyl aminopeptidase/acylaminoacyl peptidase
MRFLGAALAVCLAGSVASAQQSRPLAPVEAFVGYDTFRSATMSPSGRYIAGVRRENVGDVLVVIDWDTKQTKAIQYARADQLMEIGFVTWKDDNRLVFSISQRTRVVSTTNSAQRQKGRADDSFITPSRVLASNADGSNLVQLYNPSGDIPREISPQVVDILTKDPDHIILTAPNITGTQLLKVNISTGESRIIERGGRDTGGYRTDVTGLATLRQTVVAGGRGFAWERRGPGQSGWVEIARYRGASGANSGVDFIGLEGTETPGQMYVLARPPGKDTTGVYTYDTSTGAYLREILHVEGFDVTDEAYAAALLNKDGSLFGACIWERRYTCKLQNTAMQRHYSAMQQFVGADNNLIIASRSQDNTKWLLLSIGPRDLGTYYIYNTTTRSADILTEQRSGVAPEQLPTVEIVDYKSRDGTPLWGYLWVPPGAETAKSLPFIVHPHGGPEGRDLYGLAAGGWPQYWAAHGYLVFQPNFRGGGGFGREFVKAGWRQWGQRMQQDVRDGAEAVVASGRADRNRTCIAGWSYGGYATMTGALVDGDLYKCASAGAGVSDLLDMLAWVRSGDADRDVADGGGGGTQSMSYRYWSTAIGSANDDREMLIRYSAARNADKINIPMQLIHGDEDEIVPIQQSTAMRDAMLKAGKSVEWVMLPDTGHSPPPLLADQQRTILVQTTAFFNKHIGPGYRAPSPTN